MSQSENNNNGREELSKKKISYKLRSGEMKKFCITRESCEPFGFYFGERITVRDNKKAWVIGVRKGEGNMPNLYVHIDGQKGASYYSQYKKEDFVREGFQLVSPRIEQPYNAPHMKSLLDDKLFSDVAFDVGGTIIDAHKNILVARSDYFRAMFTGGMKEKNEKVITIPHVEANLFREMLEFLYTGKITILPHNLVSLVAVAERFQILDLKELCYSGFHQVVSEQNIVTLLLSADSHDEDNIKDLCKKYILDHCDSVIKNPEFKKNHSSREQ